MPGLRLWAKVVAATVIVGIGGPALVFRLVPTEEELFKRYNPELQKRSIENRHKTEQEFDVFVNRLKEHSKSSKPIWFAIEEAEKKERAEAAEKTRLSTQAADADREKRKIEMQQALDG